VALRSVFNYSVLLKYYRTGDSLQSQLYHQNMNDSILGSKPQFSGHETFPLRQLWLKKAFDAVNDSVDGAPKSLFLDEKAVVDFGVGKNMVSSIRFWAGACNILDESVDHLEATQIGELLFNNIDGLDPYCENISTVWLMHWFLASTPNKTTTWYFLFNHVVQQVFDRESIANAIAAQLVEQKIKLSQATLKRDVECCIRSYVPRVNSDSPEELSEPLLGELGLVIHNSKDSFEFRRGVKRSLHDGIFGYALLDYWQHLEASSSVMAFDRVAHDYGSPGRVFKIDENGVAERLIALEQISNGQIQWTEQAGLRQVTLKNSTPKNIESLKKKLLNTAYVQN
jgi:hypothetical protein